MAEHTPASGQSRGHLDASGPREVVYCHQCAHEWYRDEHGLQCPACQSEVTEIVSPESDPRPGLDAPPTPPGFRSLQNHNPWGDSDSSDPEEADIEEHITHGPGGSVFIRQTTRSSTPRDVFGRRRGARPDIDDPTYVMRDFQNMLGTLMGPGFRAGQPGRSGPDDLFPHAPFPPGHFRMRGDGPMPPVFGGRFIYTTGNLRPRDTDGPQEGGPPVDDLATYASLPPSSPSNGRSLYVISITAPPDQLASILGNMFGQMAPPPGDDPREGREGVGAGLQGLLAALLNPRNARHGDAVYSQEALDQIISTLMEQHPTSNAPGPAPPEAIAALPKKLLDEELLGPEGKGECSVCMDDVHIGDEVVMLPCSHWFHEACASAWLGEHNTCPICRKSIGDETPPSSSRRPSNGPSSPTSRNEQRSRRLSLGSRLGRESTSSRNEARLDSIRATGRLTPTEENPEPFRWQPAQMGSEEPDADLEPNLPGSYRSYRRRDSDMSIDNQRDSRRGYTSGSDRSRESLRSSGSTGNSGGPIAWLRDRFSSNSNNRRHD